MAWGLPTESASSPLLPFMMLSYTVSIYILHSIKCCIYTCTMPLLQHMLHLYPIPFTHSTIKCCIYTYIICSLYSMSMYCIYICTMSLHHYTLYLHIYYTLPTLYHQMLYLQKYYIPDGVSVCCTYTDPHYTLTKCCTYTYTYTSPLSYDMLVHKPSYPPSTALSIAIFS